MSSYKKFAYVYDILMEDIPYDEWAQYIISIWNRYKLKPKLVLDLACGTGSVTTRLHNLGFEMIGVDVSEDMLTVAKEKNKDILFLHQDMRDLDLYGTVDSIICLFDSLNYIHSNTELLDIFKLANNFLNPGGIFIFDLNTEYKFKNVLDNNSFSILKDDVACIWDNIFDDESKIIEYYVNLFIKEKNNIYKKFEEYHYEKSYTIDEVKCLILKSGLELIDVFDAFTFQKPNPNSERIYFVTKEKIKLNGLPTN